MADDLQVGDVVQSRYNSAFGVVHLDYGDNSYEVLYDTESITDYQRRDSLDPVSPDNPLAKNAILNHAKHVLLGDIDIGVPF